MPRRVRRSVAETMKKLALILGLGAWELWSIRADGSGVRELGLGVSADWK